MANGTLERSRAVFPFSIRRLPAALSPFSAPFSYYHLKKSPGLFSFWRVATYALSIFPSLADGCSPLFFFPVMGNDLLPFFYLRTLLISPAPA